MGHMVMENDATKKTSGPGVVQTVPSLVERKLGSLRCFPLGPSPFAPCSVTVITQARWFKAGASLSRSLFTFFQSSHHCKHCPVTYGGLMYISNLACL